MNPNIPAACKGCGQPLLLASLFIEDGCPCNERRGINLVPQPCDICQVEDCVRPGHRIKTLFGENVRTVQPTLLDRYLLTLDDEKVEEWAIWQGDPPNPNSTWMLDRYREETPDGMHLVLRATCTTRQASALFGVMSHLSRTT